MYSNQLPAWLVYGWAGLLLWTLPLMPMLHSNSMETIYLTETSPLVVPRTSHTINHPEKHDTEDACCPLSCICQPFIQAFAWMAIIRGDAPSHHTNNHDDTSGS